MDNKKKQKDQFDDDLEDDDFEQETKTSPQNQGPNPMGGMGKFGGHDYDRGHRGQGRNMTINQLEKNFLRQLERENAKKNNRRGRPPEPKPEPQPEKIKIQTQEQRMQRLAKKIEIPQNEQILLVDWAIRGKCEIIRLVLQYILVPYKTKSYVFKNQKDWQQKQLPLLQKKYPHIELPYLQDGDKIICGIQAMIVYIAHKYNRLDILGSTPQEQVRVRTAAEIFWQMYEEYMVLCYGQFDEALDWQQARQLYLGSKFKTYLNRLVQYLKFDTCKLNSQFTWIDFAIYQMLSLCQCLDFRFKEGAQNYHNFYSKVNKTPQMYIYRKSNRYHERPYNGFGALFK